GTGGESWAGSAGARARNTRTRGRWFIGPLRESGYDSGPDPEEGRGSDVAALAAGLRGDGAPDGGRPRGPRAHGEPFRRREPGLDRGGLGARSSAGARRRRGAASLPAAGGGRDRDRGAAGRPPPAAPPPPHRL